MPVYKNVLSIALRSTCHACTFLHTGYENYLRDHKAAGHGEILKNDVHLRLSCGYDIIKRLYLGGYGFRKVKNLSASTCQMVRRDMCPMWHDIFQVDEEEGYRNFGGCFPVRLPCAICEIKYEGNFKTEVLQTVKIKNSFYPDGMKCLRIHFTRME